jgi:HNH endonuclease.
MEHIIPLNDGGHSTKDNLALACQGCNNLKYNKTSAIDPVTLREVPLFNPRKEIWREHFIWNHDCTEIIGITPVGRATIEELRLNRENVANLRRVLKAAGKHPPSHRSSS